MMNSNTNANTNMDIDRDKDKQNAIKNSKLQMTREDLGKSKSVDKTRKGISRVTNGQLVYGKGGNNASNQNLHMGTGMGSGQSLLPLSHKMHASQVYEPNRQPIPSDNVVNLNRIRVEQFSGSSATNLTTIINKNPIQSSSSSTLHYQSQYISPSPPLQLNYNHPKPMPYSNPPPLPVPDQQQHYQQHTQPMQILDLHCKIELLEKQLTILEKENMEVRVENGIWRGKCVELERQRDSRSRSRSREERQSGTGYQRDHRNNHERQQQVQQYKTRLQQSQSQLTQIQALTHQQEQTIKNLQQQHHRLKLTLLDKQQQLKHQDKRILQLQQIITKNTNQTQIQSNNKIRELTLQLQRETNRSIQLQEQLKYIKTNNSQLTSTNSYLPQQSFNKLQQSLLTAQHKNTELQQQYRLILYKNSTLVSQKLQVQQKYQQVQQQNQQNQRRYTKLIEQYRIIQGSFGDLERQAVFGRACRNQLEEMEQIRQQNAMMKSKLKQLQTRRLNQIQFHHEQIKRVTKQQQSKSDQLIQYTLKQQQQLQKQLHQLKTQYNDKILQISVMESQHKKDKEKLVESISKDYEGVVLELKEEVVKERKEREKERDRRDRKDGEGKDVIKDKDREIQELRNKLIQLKQDNNFLMQKIQQSRHISLETKNQSKTKQDKQKHRSRSPSPPSSSLNSSLNTLQQFQTEMTSLQNYNKKLNQKIATFQLQYTKMQDKLHLLQLESQKTRTKQQSNDRKIKHLLDQIQHFTAQKQKLISQKITVTEQLQNIRINYKNKEIEFAKIMGELKSVNENYGRIESEKKEVVETLNRKILGLDMQLVKKVNEHGESQLVIGQLRKEIQYKDKELGSMRELVKLGQQQLNAIRQSKQKQKQLTKQYTSTKAQNHENQLVRIGLYRQYLIWLGKGSTGLNLDTNLYKNSSESQQMEILSKLSKTLRQFVDQKNILQQKYIKLQLQYRQNAEIQQSTRLLVHKYQQKCMELESLLIKMQQMHNQKLVLVKSDYDVLYAKYLKYRNMAIAQNKQRSKDKGIRKNFM